LSCVGNVCKKRKNGITGVDRMNVEVSADASFLARVKSEGV